MDKYKRFVVETKKTKNDLEEYSKRIQYICESKIISSVFFHANFKIEDEKREYIAYQNVFTKDSILEIKYFSVNSGKSLNLECFFSYDSEERLKELEDVLKKYGEIIDG